MRMRVNLLTTDQELVQLLPLVWEFTSLNNGVSFAQHVNEVVASFASPRSITVLGWRENLLSAYGCGYFVSEEEFVVTQAFSRSRELTKMGLQMLQGEAVKRGAKKLLLHTVHPPRLWERFGFKVSRTLMVKEVS